MQLCSDIKNRIQSEQRIRTICKRISKCFTVVSVISTTMVVLYAITALPDSPHDVYSLLQYSYSIVQLICGTAILWLIKMLFSAISNGRSPLDKKHAVFLAAIASLLLFSAGLDTISQIASFPYSNVTSINGIAEIGFVESDTEQSIHIDARSLVASLFLFSIAAVFSYAAELQAEANETI